MPRLGYPPASRTSLLSAASDQRRTAPHSPFALANSRRRPHLSLKTARNVYGFACRTCRRFASIRAAFMCNPRLACSCTTDNTKIAGRGISAAPISWLAQSLAMRPRLSWDILRQGPRTRLSRWPGRHLFSVIRRALRLRMPVRRADRARITSLTRSLWVHAIACESAAPDVISQNALICDGPVALAQNVCPRLNRTNGHFCVSTSAFRRDDHFGLPFRPSPSLCHFARLYFRPHTMSNLYKAHTSLSA